MEHPKWWNNPNKRKKSNIQEKKLAKDLGGSTVVNSGASKWDKGDVRFQIRNFAYFLAECKRTDKRSFSIKLDIWNKIKREAKAESRIPVMFIDIQDLSLVVMEKKDLLT